MSSNYVLLQLRGRVWKELRYANVRTWIMKLDNQCTRQSQNLHFCKVQRRILTVHRYRFLSPIAVVWSLLSQALSPAVCGLLSPVTTHQTSNGGSILRPHHILMIFFFFDFQSSKKFTRELFQHSYDDIVSFGK